MTGPFRETREPCRECARREAEGPRLRWWQEMGMTWRRVYTMFVLATFFSLATIIGKHLAWKAQQPPPPSRAGALGERCRDNALCDGLAVCVRENPNYYSTNFICVPFTDDRIKAVQP